MPTIKSYQKQREKEQIATQYFLNQGYSPEAVAGIVGNLVYESGLNTKAEGDIGFRGGSSFGIAQFRGQRLKNLKNRYGDNWTDFNNQLDFVRHELETTHKKAGNALKNAQNSYDAGRAFSDLYEIPAKKYKDNTARQKQVNRIYSSLGKTPISDAVISNVNEYFNTLPAPQTDEVILDTPVDTTTDIEEEKTVPEKEDEDIKEVKQQTAEYNFLRDYQEIISSPQQEIVAQEELQQRIIATPNLQDIFQNVSEFVDSPYAQQGGQATRQDSINLRNNALNFKNAIQRLNYEKVYEKPYSPQDDIYRYVNGKVTLNTTDKDLMDHLRTVTNTRSNGDVYLNSNVNRTGDAKVPKPEDVKKGGGIGYNVPLLKKVNDNQYLTSEQSSFLGYNTDIPNLLMDGRIKPQIKSKYRLEETNMNNGDFVIFNEYDPIAVTPFDMLLDSQKKERIRLYGRGGVPETYNNSIKPHEKLDSVNSLNPAGLAEVNLNNEFSQAEIPNQYIQPKYWDIQDTVNQTFGGTKTSYRVTPENADYMLSTIAPEPYNTRKVTPYYQNGGIIGNLTPQQTDDIEKQRKWLNNWNLNREIGGKKINTNSEIPFSSDIYIDELNYGNNGREITLGEFDRVSDRLILDTNYQSKSGVPVHEFTHRYQKYLNPDTYSKYINQPISEALKQTQGSSEYHGDIDENQAELNRLRYNSGFRPEQIITPQDLQEYNPEEYNLKHFSQDQLINLLNTTAYNDYSNVTFAQTGGEIINDNRGQWANPGSTTRISSPNITMQNVNYPVIGVSEQTGEKKLMTPNNDYFFENTTSVIEYPQLTENEKEFLKHISQL